MKKILVINVNWVGDVIFSSPFFKALKLKYPDCQIHCMAPSRVKDVLKSNPFIDRIIEYNEKGEHKSVFAKLKLIYKLRKEKFKGVFVMHKSFTKALIAFMAGIPVRVGYDTKKRKFLLTHSFNEPSGKVHRSDYYLNILESYGIKVDDRNTFLKVSEDAKKSVGRLLTRLGVKEDDLLVVINPGGNWDLKRWPKENWVVLIDMLHKYSNIKMVITGARKDAGLAYEIAELSGNKTMVLAGKTTLNELMAFMQKAQIVISADSGPLHIASSVGTKTIALYGPTDIKITGPRGANRAINIKHDIGCNREACYFLKCNDNVCMKSIDAQQVVDAFERLRNY